MATSTRAYRFVVEFMVEPDHPPYNDPEWAADAAWGALTNMYGLLSSCTSIEEIDPRDALQPPRCTAIYQDLRADSVVSEGGLVPLPHAVRPSARSHWERRDWFQVGHVGDDRS